MDDWQNAFPTDANDLRRRLEAFAAALRACALSWHVTDAEDLRHRAKAIRDDVHAGGWLERVMACEIERCRRDAAADLAQLAMIDMIEQLLREPAATG